MEKAFKHPLARHATTTKARQRDGAEQPLLVIVTTLELDEGAKGFSKKNVERLHGAAAEYVSGAPELSGYTIVNRPKDWEA